LIHRLNRSVLLTGTNLLCLPASFSASEQGYDSAGNVLPLWHCSTKVLAVT
jgi:hypothetical protein